MYRLEAIYLYPVKSLGGIALQEAHLERRGLLYDRRWMLVDEQGRFISQREYPALARLGTALQGRLLRIFEKEAPSRFVDLAIEPPVEVREKRTVQVWGDYCRACVYPPEVNAWFSDYLHARVQLVFMPDNTLRRADGRYTPNPTTLSFADGFPYLLIGLASLEDLNRRLAQPVPMSRFRPNLVFSGGRPYEEDSWREFWIGEAQFLAVKPCARCAVVSTDQETGMRHAEPLQTLATYRRRGNRILFGQNALWTGEGSNFIRVGLQLTKGC